MTSDKRIRMLRSLQTSAKFQVAIFYFGWILASKDFWNNHLNQEFLYTKTFKVIIILGNSHLTALSWNLTIFCMSLSHPSSMCFIEWIGWTIFKRTLVEFLITSSWVAFWSQFLIMTHSFEGCLALVEVLSVFLSRKLNCHNEFHKCFQGT